jgi:hypothetical protein
MAQHQLPTGMGTIYYLLTPPGVTVCLDTGTSTGHCSDYSGSPGETSYKHSFCSYHSDVNPGKLATGDANTILYAAIPWTAGGKGDYHLLIGDQRSAFDCQDGGFDPSSKPIEKKEATKTKSIKEKEEFEGKSPEEKEAQEKAELLEGPRGQEPNQVPCPSSDGGCDAGLADLVVSQLAAEQQNIVTNPLLNAWQDSARNELTDECRNFFAPTLGGSANALEGSEAGTLFNQTINHNPYYLNTAFNRAAFTLDYPGIACVSGAALEPHFTAPSSVNAGELVGFDGMESNITLNATIAFPVSGAGKTTYPVYTWDFGDGTPTVTGYAPGAPSQNAPENSQCEAPFVAPCAGSVFHSYQYGGNYEVTLTVKDVAANSASVTKVVTVNGPSRPSEASSPSSPGPTILSGGGSSASGGSAGGAAGAHPTPPTPVATQAVVSHSLAKVLRSGLVIRYSVSEQVAGRFEVLLASSIARKLGLRGAPATGLATGTPPQTVIAKAILVTTKGGSSTYHIRFSKSTAARLRHLRKVSLMLRLAVHNASSPTVTTVLSTVNLSR